MEAEEDHLELQSVNSATGSIRAENNQNRRQLMELVMDIFITLFDLFPNSALISTTDGAARILSFHLMLEHNQREDDMALSWFKPTLVELHQTGTFEGCSAN